jgi:Family of unknown function (DUF5681)
MDKLETELKNQRKPGFQPGVSGNPKGKPKGARCRVTVLAEKLMADNAQDIIQATIDAAKNGDSVAMRLCVERLVPIRKWVPAPVDLPTSDSLSGVVAALNEIAELVASGKLDIESGVALTNLLEAKRVALEAKLIEDTDLNGRMTALETQGRNS